ncbi:MAG: hypothetical protein QM731_03340 [Chitinophagaceae bacterium]
MKKIQTFLSVILAVCCLPVHCVTQSAGEVIQHHIAAMGGREKLQAIRSLYMEYTIKEAMDTVPSCVFIVSNKGYRNNMRIMGYTITTCYTDQGGWLADEFKNIPAHIISKGMYDQHKDKLEPAGALLHYAEKGNKVSYLGREQENHVITLVTPDDFTIYYYIDTATGYIAKIKRTAVFEGKPVAATIFFSDYRKTGEGYIMPYSFFISIPSLLGLTCTVTTVRINQPLDPSQFLMPGS